jgi:NADH-quinone oxidoreductase subunit F
MDYVPARFHRSERVLAEPGEPFAFTPENQAKFDEVVARYPPDRRKSAILYALYLAQAQNGYLTAAAMRHVAEQIQCTPAEVEDVVSYYTMFYTRPVGTYVLNVCRTLSCALLGAERVTEELSRTLGIKPGQTDSSGTFTLIEVECLGACDRAPVVMVNDDWHEGLTPEQCAAFVAAVRARGSQALTGVPPPQGGGSDRMTEGPKPAYEPVLTRHVGDANAFTLDSYLRNQRGYEGLRAALAVAPNDVIERVKASGLRGRGGAGFPTGMKWQFVLKDTPNPKYICCNADESEPGTFKDHVLMERNPHLLIEGCAIACYAIGAKVAYVYIRGEFYHVQRILEAEIAKAYAAGYLGKNIFGSGFDCDVFVHRGAGAYEAGEETALIESLEGKRAQPRLKPPFPASAGLYQCPTAVNNVETLCNVPLIMLNGAEWFAALGPEKNGGPKLYCVSGHVKKPGVYEASMHTTLRELVYDHAGGIRGDRP